MPYAIKKRGKSYSVVNKNSGKIHSKTTKAKASRQMKLLEAIENGTNKKAGTLL